jgi:alkanesulfonate monooxygenase SsuD/methylene tetrahydromethanopterin reductase-like flavin-dependent oxidoreductase (luciferase family)
MDLTIAPNPLTTLTAVGQVTENVRLGTATFAAPFWHLIKFAEEAAMMDLITGGQLDLGIARGAYTHEYKRLGAPDLDAWQAGQKLRL